MSELKIHCKHCGRWLVAIHKNDTFDIAPKASISCKLDLLMMIEGRQPHGKPLPETATCYAFHCKARRVVVGWWMEAWRIWTTINGSLLLILLALGYFTPIGFLPIVGWFVGTIVGFLLIFIKRYREISASEKKQ